MKIRQLHFLTFQLVSINNFNFILFENSSIFVISKINETNMIEKFDLREVIKYYGADINEVAKALYPDRQYPRLALDRVLSGKTNLDTDQLIRLARFLGVFVQDLFNVGSWKGETRNGALTFTKGEYSAEYRNGVCTIRCGDKVKNVVVPPGTAVSDIINILNKIKIT